jgi:cell volume regulation protein A
MVMEILLQFTVILIAGIVLKFLADKVGFPFIVFLMFGGVFLASYGFSDMAVLGNLPELIRTLALIIIVFSSGFHLRLSEITKQSRPIISLATIGVFFTALIIAVTGFWLLSLPLVTAALFGALMCGTDPAAIGEAGKETKVLTILKSESLFNAPLTIILPLFILDYLRVVQSGEQFFLIPMFEENIARLATLVAVGTVVGLIGFKGGGWLIKYGRAMHPQALGLIIALLTYVAAEMLGGSGILAVAVCSVFLSSVRLPEKKWLGEFNKELAFVFVLLVFVMMGAEFTFADLIFITRFDVIAVIVALLVGRLIASIVALNGSGLKLKEKVQIGLIAPKGVGPAALAPLLLSPVYGIVGAEKLVVITFLAIILSIVISLVFLRLFSSRKVIKQLKTVAASKGKAKK